MEDGGEEAERGGGAALPSPARAHPRLYCGARSSRCSAARRRSRPSSPTSRPSARAVERADNAPPRRRGGALAARRCSCSTRWCARASPTRRRGGSSCTRWAFSAVAVLAAPDFAYAFRAIRRSRPLRRPLPHAAGARRSDWPTCLIIGMHVYHMLAFKLNSSDAFPPPFVRARAAGSILSTRGAPAARLVLLRLRLPGGIDYLMLTAVKCGKMAPIVEKRIRCSIKRAARPGHRRLLDRVHHVLGQAVSWHAARGRDADACPS